MRLKYVNIDSSGLSRRPYCYSCGCRRKMDIHCGDQVILSYHDGELHIATRKQRLQQAKDIVKACAGNISLVEELVEERRAEAND